MQRYFVGQDNDCHWYLIPVELYDKYSAWIDMDPKDPASWEEPEGIERIDGPHRLTFTDPREDDPEIYARKLIITVEKGHNVQEVENNLKKLGVTVEKVMDKLGILYARIQDENKLAEVREVQGVFAADIEKIVRATKQL
jgi:hypothetical protein